MSRWSFSSPQPPTPLQRSISPETINLTYRNQINEYDEMLQLQQTLKQDYSRNSLNLVDRISFITKQIDLLNSKIEQESRQKSIFDFRLEDRIAENEQILQQIMEIENQIEEMDLNIALAQATKK